MCLTNINLHGNLSYNTPPFIFHVMNYFISDHDIINNKLPRHKCRLHRINELVIRENLNLCIITENTIKPLPNKQIHSTTPFPSILKPNQRNLHKLAIYNTISKPIPQWHQILKPTPFFIHWKKVIKITHTHPRQTRSLCKSMKQSPTLLLTLHFMKAIETCQYTFTQSAII